MKSTISLIQDTGATIHYGTRFEPQVFRGTQGEREEEVNEYEQC